MGVAKEFSEELSSVETVEDEDRMTFASATFPSHPAALHQVSLLTATHTTKIRSSVYSRGKKREKENSHLFLNQWRVE